MKRRDFLKAGIGLGLLTSLPVSAAFRKATYFSCRANQQGEYFVSGLDNSGNIQFDIQLPGRGHGMLLHPQREQLIIFARRPGTFMWVVDLVTQTVSHKIESPEARHFYGHGSLSHDGRYLYTSENDYEATRGVIAVYDTLDSYRRIDELESYGIDPHELVTLNNSPVLAVCNGGIQTHPDFHRTKLNLESMDPNLAYIDIESGRLLDAYRPPKAFHQLSIRHMAITRKDKICVAMQYQGPVNQHPPLIATHQGEDSLQFIEMDEPLTLSLNNYCGSVCIDTLDNWFAVSSPRGNKVLFIPTTDSQSTEVIDVPDGCGIAKTSHAGEFLISSGNGTIRRYQPGRTSTMLHPKDQAIKWDNHMSS